jgi:hypothetical protein
MKIEVAMIIKIAAKRPSSSLIPHPPSLALLLVAGVMTLQPAGAEPKSRVVVAQDPAAIQSFDPNPGRVHQLVEQGILRLTQMRRVADAWSVFAGSNDVVGIKIVARSGPLFSVRKDVVAAVVDGLRSAGVRDGNIIVWDKYQSDLIEAGYKINDGTNATQIVGIIPGIGFDREVKHRSPYAGKLIWGDLLFGQPDDISGESHLTRLITQRLTKLINIAVLTDHSEVGLSGCLFNLATGSVDNTRRFQNSAAACDTAVPEICAMPELRDKTVLHIVDGLLGQYALGPNFHPEFTWHHGAIYFSTDPVALDVVSLAEIEARRKRAGLASIASRAAYIQGAAAFGLGTANPTMIETVRVGGR